MKAKILNFRGGRHTQYNNELIVKVDKIDTREKAQEFLGKQAVWTTPSGKEIKGEVSKIHGNKGALLVRFEKGMPGQSLTKDIEVN